MAWCKITAVFFIITAFVAEGNLTSLNILETKFQALQVLTNQLKQDVQVLNSDVNSIIKTASLSMQYCHLQPAKVCGPCMCRDDPRILKKYFCDCQDLGAKRDCTEFYNQGIKVDGIYLVNQLNLKTIQVYCDQTTDGGGWTVIQRRIDGSENFYRDWQSYKNGFGYLQHEHWIGNQHIHTLELQSKFGKGTELRVEMMTMSGSIYYAKYSWFQVGNENTKYRLHLGGHSGNVSDYLQYHNGAMFTTIDKDNDKWSSGNCAQKYKGGWWSTSNCPNYCNLNGHYYHLGESVSYYTGLTWYSLTYGSSSLKRTEMKIRRKQ